MMAMFYDEHPSGGDHQSNQQDPLRSPPSPSAESSMSYLSSMASMLLCANTVQPGGSTTTTLSQKLPLVKCVGHESKRGDVTLELFAPREERVFDTAVSRDERRGAAWREAGTERKLDEVQAFAEDLSARHPHPALEQPVVHDPSTASAFFSKCLALGDPWAYATRRFLRCADDDLDTDDHALVARRRPRDDLVAVRAQSALAWLASVYLPVLAAAYAYLSLLDRLGALGPRDWANGGCALALLTTPLVFTVLLAILLADPSPASASRGYGGGASRSSVSEA